MRRVYFLLIALVLAGVALFLFLRAKPVVGSSTMQGDIVGGPTTVAVDEAKTDSVALGEKPKSADAATKDKVSDAAKPDENGANAKKKSTPNIGSVQPVAGNSNPQTASVLEALKTKSHPDRLSIMHAPETPFDKAKFETNPKEYLDVVQPGRIFQTMQPGEGVPALKVAGDGYYRVKQGETVKLVAQGAPLAPVTFTSTDLGAFAENKLNSVTVRADEKGMATVTFVATPGTINDVNILAGSPLASGQAHFKVDIEQLVAHSGPTSNKK